ncbi:DUF1643 domain-containing protein [Bacillus inaquosorum]
MRSWTTEEKVKAIFNSDDETKRLYRYMLDCEWDEELNKVTFIMLNPSIADTSECDKTLNRCVNFSKSWGYGGMIIVNLFAYISPHPQDLKKADNPIGENNNEYILEAVKMADKIILAWGNTLNGKVFNRRKKEVLELLKGHSHYCIKKTKDNKFPRHPLYLSSELKPIPY